jgi:hypothetical protein
MRSYVAVLMLSPQLLAACALPSDPHSGIGVESESSSSRSTASPTCAARERKSLPSKLPPTSRMEPVRRFGGSHQDQRPKTRLISF